MLSLFENGKKLRESKPVHGTKMIAEAAQMGLPEAQLEYAESLFVGRGVDHDVAEAVQWFRKAAEHKNATQAQYRLGYVLEQPTTIDNNPEEAALRFEVVAKDGHMEAAFHLGRMYLEGRGVEVSFKQAIHWLQKAAFFETDVKLRDSATLLLVAALDRHGDLNQALIILETCALRKNPYAQLQLAWRYQLGIGTPVDKVKAREWLNQAAKHETTDHDVAILIAKTLLVNDYDSMSVDKQDILIRPGIDFEGDLKIGRDTAGRRTVECTMRTKDSDNRPRVMLVVVENKADNIKRYLSECITLPTDADPSTQPLGVACNVDLLYKRTGLREVISFALIMPAPLEQDQPQVPATDEGKEDSQHVMIMKSGHHGNLFLAVMGDMDKIMPTLLKYLNRDWKRDIAEKKGLEWLPQRLHLSLGKPAFGDIYIGKIGVGCSCWMYVILSTPPPTLRPEIHTAFPVIVSKARKFYLRVERVLEWHNRIEATAMCEIEYTTDDECTDAVRASPPTTPKRKTTFPMFAIDFVGRRNIWESHGILEVYASGIALWIVRKPEESLQTPAPQPWLEDIDEKKQLDITTPRSVVPDIVDKRGKPVPWSVYKDVRGIIVNEGPLKENRICYVQGTVVRTIQLPGTIWGKSAYMITVRIDEELKIDLDLWCLLKHMIHGKAKIVPGEYMSINAGTVPEPGDLVYAEVWIHGTIATDLKTEPVSGTLVKRSE